MNKKLIRKMQTAAGGPLRIKFTPEQIALFESRATRVPGMNNSGGNRYREEGVLALQHLEQEAKRKEEEIKSRMEMRPVIKRKATFAEKLQGKKDEYELKPLVVGMSGTDPVGEFILAGIGLNGVGALAKTGLWNVAKYAPTTQLGNWGRGYFIGNAFKNSFNGTVPTLTSQATSLLYLPVKLNETGLTSLKFFERPTLSNAQLLAGATKWERNFNPKWHVANYPGYLLKGLMKGSLLEKQLSKNGTININLLNAYFNKASQLEREIFNKVLAEKFNGLKTIDYNLLKKAVLDELIGKYNRVPLTEWADYGVEGLGYNLKTVGENELPGLPNLIILGLPVRYISPGTKADPINLSTFTFESPRILYGNTKHYGGKPIGHSRTYTIPDEPNVLYVMESQSDWALQALRKRGSVDAQFAYERASLRAAEHLQEIKLMKANLEKGLAPDGHKIQYEWELRDIEEIIKNAEKQLTNNNARAARFDAILHPEKYVLENYLKQNYLLRQLQENLRYAAENGLTKMRYPTRESAIKIEGYTPAKQPSLRELSDAVVQELKSSANAPTPYSLELFDLRQKLLKLTDLKEINRINSLINRIQKIENRWKSGEITYPSDHETILDKYSDFPKLFLKLFKDLKVRIVTDAKGNTWYEVDVPKGYLSREWLFKQGGKMNILELFKRGGQIRKMLTAAGGPIELYNTLWVDNWRNRLTSPIVVAKQLEKLTSKIPIKYLGGSKDNARKEFWKQEPVLQHAVDSIASLYRINPESLKYRLDKEGFTDLLIKRVNASVKQGTQRVHERGYKLLNDHNYNLAGTLIGLDDAKTYIDSGKVKLINEKWFDLGKFQNEKGRITYPVEPVTLNDGIGIVAAHLKYFRDKALLDFPNASEYDLDRYANAYYNRGALGGKKWVLAGAKGYNYRKKGGMLEFLKNGNKIKKVLLGTNLNVDTRSDTTRQGYNERRMSSVQSHNYFPLLDFYNAVEEISLTSNNPYLNTGIVYTPSRADRTWKFLQDFVKKNPRVLSNPTVVSKGIIPGNEITVGQVKQPLTGLTVRNNTPLTLENTVMNPAEKAAAEDYLASRNLKNFEEFPDVTINTKLPTGRPTGDYKYPKEIMEKYGFNKPKVTLQQLTTKPVSKTSSQRSKEYYSKKKEDKNNGVSRERSRLVLNNKALTTGDMRAANIGRPRRAARNSDLEKELEKDNGYWGREFNKIKLKVALKKQGSEQKYKDFLNSYWNYKLKGILSKERFGGILNFYKKGGGIHIKEKNKGKFTSYCGGKVTDECIRKAKASGNPTLVKRATFADNARHWKHEKGGLFPSLKVKKHQAFVPGASITDSNPKAYKYLKKHKYSSGGFLKDVGDFLKSDSGKGMLDLGKSLFSGISDYKQTSNLLDGYLNKIAANANLQYEQALMDAEIERQKTPDIFTNTTGEVINQGVETIANGWLPFSLKVSAAKRKLDLLNAAVDLLIRDVKGQALGNMFGSFVLNGLGTLANILG